ncbi:MAG: hypothetical protein ACT4OS_07620 [Acidimicrobiales bacterium]
MPTPRPRHMVTESQAVAQALDAAAQVWPEDAARRSRLLLRLVAAGHRALCDEQATLEVKRRDALIRTRGSLSGAYGPNYLDELRQDWAP